MQLIMYRFCTALSEGNIRPGNTSFERNKELVVARNKIRVARCTSTSKPSLLMVSLVVLATLGVDCHATAKRSLAVSLVRVAYFKQLASKL